MKAILIIITFVSGYSEQTTKYPMPDLETCYIAIEKSRVELCKQPKCEDSISFICVTEGNRII